MVVLRTEGCLWDGGTFGVGRVEAVAQVSTQVWKLRDPTKARESR